jgi:hypothetical protein
MGARSRLRECPGGRAHARISSDSPRSTKTDGLFGGWCSLMRTSLPCRNSPDQQGKNREFREFRLWSQTQGGKKLRLYAGFRADSLFDHNREIFWRNREFDPAEQGFEVFDSGRRR